MPSLNGDPLKELYEPIILSSKLSISALIGLYIFKSSTIFSSLFVVLVDDASLLLYIS